MSRKFLLWASLIIVLVVAINELFWLGKTGLAWVIIGIAVAVGLQAVYFLSREDDIRQKNKKLKHAENEQETLTKSEQRSLVNRVLFNFILWIFISGFLSGLFFAIEYVTGTGAIGWALKVSIVVSIIVFNLAAADILRHYVKCHGRNTVAWIIAIIVFTPFLTGVAYLLTWPKNQPKNSLYAGLLAYLLTIGVLIVVVGMRLVAPDLTADEVKAIVKSQYQAHVVSADYKGQGEWRVKVASGRGWSYLIFDENTGELNFVK